MLQIYRFLINFIFLLSPIILIFRLFKNKEDIKRFKEKFCFFSKKRNHGKLLWFHGASVGEIQSIIPLIEKFEKHKEIKQILITSNTLSSSKIFKKFQLKKTIHQFFPIDTNHLSKKFLNYWKPSAAFFIDSEIWPNTITNLSKNKIPIILINGRITENSFNKWQKLSYFSYEIFKKINLCFPSSKQTEGYLKKLGVKNIKFFGNLKFSQSENEKLFDKDSEIKKFIANKKTWCASSTHETEELISGLVHKKLKKKYKNLLTFIIPRHVERTDSIIKELNSINLVTHTHEPKRKIPKNTDIYIVNSYGKTKSFYNICKNIFLGGSLINHGGQNPLEATRYGCNVLYGPNVNNFKEIYKFLDKLKISNKINNNNQLSYKLDKLLSKKHNSKKIQYKLNSIGDKILNNTYKQINLFFNNEV
jgi:3-deoxy-D-manno-octulosonic-acid transferase